MPTSNGFNTFSMIISMSSPLPEQEPIPDTPSSVSTCTSVVDRVFLTPDRLSTCPSAGIVARRRIVLTSVIFTFRSEEHTSELQSQSNLVCRLLLEKKKNKN